MLKHNLDFETAKSKFHFTRVTFIDSGCSEKRASELQSPRIFKSHLLSRFLPDDFEKKAKAIYVMRNPKDLVVSQFSFFHSGLISEEFNGTFEEYVDLFLNGGQIYGPWWDHVNDYMSREGFYIITYEDLLQVSSSYIQLIILYFCNVFAFIIYRIL